MYLLQINSGYALPIMITAAIIGLLILYMVIRVAVEDGTKEMRNQLRILSHLKVKELSIQGLPDAEINKAVDEALLLKTSRPTPYKQLKEQQA